MIEPDYHRFSLGRPILIDGTRVDELTLPARSSPEIVARVKERLARLDFEHHPELLRRPMVAMRMIEVIHGVAQNAVQGLVAEDLGEELVEHLARLAGLEGAER